MKVKDLKAGLDSIDITVRVILTKAPAVIETKSGARKIQEAIVGDETGRVKLTLWGELTGKIKKGKVYRITNAWSSAYRGRVQLHAGSKSKVEEVKDSDIPVAELIPNKFPPAGEYRFPIKKSLNTNKP